VSLLPFFNRQRNILEINSKFFKFQIPTRGVTLSEVEERHSSFIQVTNKRLEFGISEDWNFRRLEFKPIFPQKTLTKIGIWNLKDWNLKFVL
jgi:hypothetical protein